MPANEMASPVPCLLSKPACVAKGEGASQGHCCFKCTGLTKCTSSPSCVCPISYAQCCARKQLVSDVDVRRHMIVHRGKAAATKQAGGADHCRNACVWGHSSPGVTLRRLVLGLQRGLGLRGRWCWLGLAPCNGERHVKQGGGTSTRVRRPRVDRVHFAFVVRLSYT